MDKAGYTRMMQEAGFPEAEAKKMAEYALLDFNSFDEAADYYRHSVQFWRGMAYEGHRKARRTFMKKGKKPGPWTRKLLFWRKHRRFWTVRQRFFRTRAGKGLQSAVYRLAQKFPESKMLERVLFHLLPF